jgi:hypothetical protein
MPRQDSTVTPLRWLSEAQRNQLVVRIRDACTRVLSEWSAARGGSLPSVRYDEDRRALDGSRFYVQLKSETLAAWTFESDGLQHLLHLPLGLQISERDADGFSGRLELELVTALSNQLLSHIEHEQLTIRRAPLDDASEFDNKVARHVFAIGVEGQTCCCQLELSPVWVNKLIPRSTAPAKASLVSRRAAIGSDVVKLNATLGHIKLSFNELHGLRVGDVLVMDAALTNPISIHTSSGRAVADATLGRRKTQLALQIATLAMPNLATKRSTR